MQKITMNIKDMHCPACVMRLEGLEDQLPGIAQITASYKKNTMTVEFDEHQITLQEIHAAIASLGYTVS